jgi:probable H4MPT-linked C1 transfer pathway protein
VEAAGRRQISVWQNDGCFATVAQARRDAHKTAAANWLALATFAARYCRHSGSALVVDVGSTTTDIVPIRNGVPVPRGHTDTERMAARELLYMGVRRTPLCALLGLKSGFTWREQRVPPAAEVFATTQDVYLVLGDLPEDPTSRDTADGRPATKRHAHARLARTICMDADTFAWEDALAMAREVREFQLAALLHAARSLKPPRQRQPQTIVLAGAGEFLARAAFRSDSHRQARLISLADKLGSRLSEAACAYAVAVLAAERLDA